MNEPHRDLIAFFADAWDGRGRQVMTPLSDHLAMLRLASLPETLCRTAWAELTVPHRYRLMLAGVQALGLSALLVRGVIHGR